MKTIILDLESNYNEAITTTADILNDGGVIAFPTDTVYGVGSDLFNSDAIDKIYELKNRVRYKPLTAYLSNIVDVNKFCSDVPDHFFRLADRFLPGPISVVLKAQEIIPKTITGGMDTIAIRIPDNRFLLDLIKKLDRPLAGTSANFSGSPSLSDFSTMMNIFDSRIPLIINGGNCKYGIESTVVDLSTKKPSIIREGYILKKEIEEILNVHF